MKSHFHQEFECFGVLDLDPCWGHFVYLSHFDKLVVRSKFSGIVESSIHGNRLSLTVVFSPRQ